MTFAETLLWAELRARRLAGLRFRRQHPVLGYIIDFYCHELRLAIEVDGDSHVGREECDPTFFASKTLKSCACATTWLSRLYPKPFVR